MSLCYWRVFGEFNIVLIDRLKKKRPLLLTDRSKV